MASKARSEGTTPEVPWPPSGPDQAFFSRHSPQLSPFLFICRDGMPAKREIYNEITKPGFPVHGGSLPGCQLFSKQGKQKGE